MVNDARHCFLKEKLHPKRERQHFWREYDAGLTSGQTKRERKTGLKATSCELHNPRILNFIPGHTAPSVFLEVAAKSDSQSISRNAPADIPYPMSSYKAWLDIACKVRQPILPFSGEPSFLKEVLDRVYKARRPDCEDHPSVSISKGRESRVFSDLHFPDEHKCVAAWRGG